MSEKKELTMEEHGKFGIGEPGPEYTLNFTDNNTDPILTIDYEGTVTIHKEGGDKEAAKLFYDAFKFEGKTLREKIKELEKEIEKNNDISRNYVCDSCYKLFHGKD